ANRGDGDVAADVVRKEQDDFTQKDGVSDLSLAATLFPLQNIPNYHGGVNAFQKGQCFFLIQPDIRNPRHPAKTHIGVKDFPQAIAFAVLIKYLSAGPAQGAAGFSHFKVVEIQKLPE